MHRAIILLSLITLLAAPTLAAGPATRLDLTDCDYLESLNVVPGALVDPLVPPEFAVGPVTQLVVGVAQCTATTSGGATGAVTFGWADVSVQPIPALRSPQGGLYLYRIEHLAMDDLYGAAHAAVGAECRMVDDASVLVSALGTHATLSAGGAALWDIQVPASVEPDGSGPVTHYREFGRAEGGYAYLEGDLVNPGALAVPGTFLVDDASALRAVWGPAWPSRIVAAEGFAITGTTIGFLPWASAPTPATTC